MSLTFYISLLTDTVWHHHLYADLAALQSDWSTKQHNSWTAAIIHLGYDCPDYTNSLLPNLSRFHVPKPVYLTDAATWTLPAGLTNTTPFALSHASVLGRNTLCGLSLCLDHWGYSLSSQHIADLQHHFSPFHPQGWVRDFLRQHPHHEPAFIAHYIQDDRNFTMECEHLEPQLKHTAECYRFRALLLTVDQESPAAIISLLPEQSLARPLSTLSLTARLRRAFNSMNVDFVRDLKPYSDADFAGYRHVGGQSLATLARILIVGEDTETVPRTQSSTLLTLFKHYVSSLPDRDGYIVSCRYSLDGTPFHTLEHLGDTYSVSFERIRQIETHHLTSFGTLSQSTTVLAEKLKDVLANRTTALYIDELPALDAWFACSEDEIPSLARLVDKLSPQSLHAVTLGSRVLLCHLRQANLEKFIKGIRAGIRAMEPKECTPDGIKAYVAHMCSEKQVPTLADAITSEVSTSHAET
jgi:hypothetical protein